MPQPSIELTADMLKDLISTAVSTAIQEAKKPAPATPEQESQLKMKQEHRQKTADSILQTEKQKKNYQKICSHEHSRREGGGTHCVWIREEDPTSPGYILCQSCQGRIRPDVPEDKRLDRGAIYDTVLFNKNFQECNEGSLIQ